MTKIQNQHVTTTSATTGNNSVQKKKKVTISEALINFIEDNNGAVGKEGFTKLLKMINKNNVVAQLKDYNSKSPDKSIIARILSESMSDKEDQREALIGDGNGKDKIMGIYTLLLEHAKDVGVDEQTIETYKTDFETALDKELSKVFSSVRFDSTKLDTLMNALIQTIDNVKTSENITDEQINLQSGGTASKIQTGAYNVIAKRYNQAQKDFDTQLKQDGWAGDLADAFGKIYGSKNTASKVRADLKTAKEQCFELNAALKEGDGAFSAKFKEIFGIPYSEANIVAYQKAEATYLEAAKAKAQEDYFADTFALLLNGKPLTQETQMVMQSVSAGTSHQVLSASKEDVYKREFNKLANLMGKNGASNLNEIIKATVGENASVDKKYEVLQKFVQNTFKNLQSDTNKACGGRSFDSVQKTYDNSYKAAYGVENDIMKRVTEYNLSQQKGAGVVKGISTALITAAGAALVVGSGGTATPVVAMIETAAVATAAPVAVELTDRATSGKALDKLREGSITDYLKTVNDDVDWSSVAKTAATNGALTIMFMGQSYAVANLCRAVGASAVTTGVANAAGTIATGLGTEYLMKGEITVEGSIFVVTMAVVGGIMTVKSIKAAEAAQTKAMAEQHAADIHAARETLGFSEGQEITADGLKAQYRKLSIENHPDRGGSTAKMAEINNAYEFLEMNIADLNIKAPVIKASAPAASEVRTSASENTTADTSNDFAGKLTKYKDANGQQFLSNEEISSILQNRVGLGGELIKDFEAKIEAVLSNPDEIASISSWKSRGAGVWRAIQDPLQTTLDKNPELFGVKPQTTTAKTTDFASKLTEYKDANGQQFLSSEEITALLQNRETLGGELIKDFEAKIEAVLSNPDEIASISSWKSRGAGVWRAIQDPLQTTLDKNPELFGVKPQTTTEAGMPKNYRTRFETPDYSNVRSKFPSDSYQTQTKQGKATAYTTTGEPDGIVYRGDDGKLYVPNKWSPESPHEVKPGSVIMVYDEAGGDFAVGDPTVIAKTYRNAANEIDPLYDVEPGRTNAIEITKDVVPSAFKIVPEGTVVKTKEAPNGVTVKEGQAVMYDIDGDPYVVDIQKTLLKRQEPVGEAAKAAMQSLKETGKLPESNIDQKAMVVTRANGTKVDVLAGISEDVLASPTSSHLNMPNATTVPDAIGVTITQAKASPVEAKRIIFADTVEETLRVNNENGIPLKYEANPPAGEEPYFYKDAPYGGRQKVNTQSVEVTYNYDADASWGVTPEYMAEYSDPVTGKAPDRAVVAAGNDPKTGIKGNIAEKQYEIVNPDGSRSPLVVDDLAPGQTVNIIKKEGVELRMAIFDHETVSLEGETIPAGKPVMIDSEGHPYAGNPLKRLISGEVKLPESNDSRLNSIAAKIEEISKASKADAKRLTAELEPEFNSWLHDMTKQAEVAHSAEGNAQAATASQQTTTITKQSAPSQKLPDVVDKIYGAKAEAEAIVFGNGTLADVDPQIVQNATKELSNYFGREITQNDLQVVRTSKGPYISYFDNETNLATTFSRDGELNGQYKVKFDNQGNIQSYDLETIYADGKFWLR